MPDPDNILDELGRNLILEWILLHYHHVDPVDPWRKELAQLTGSIVQLLSARVLANQPVGKQSQAEAMKNFTAAAERFARANRTAAA